MAEAEVAIPTEQSACAKPAHARQGSQLSCAAAEYVPNAQLPPVSVSRTVSGLDEGVKSCSGATLAGRIGFRRARGLLKS